MATELSDVLLSATERKQRIRERAYQIWLRWGRSGTPEQNWFEAEVELELEGTGFGSSEGSVDGSEPEASGAARLRGAL